MLPPGSGASDRRDGRYSKPKNRGIVRRRTQGTGEAEAFSGHAGGPLSSFLVFSGIVVEPHAEPCHPGGARPRWRVESAMHAAGFVIAAATPRACFRVAGPSRLCGGRWR